MDRVRVSTCDFPVDFDMPYDPALLDIAIPDVSIGVNESAVGSMGSMDGDAAEASKVGDGLRNGLCVIAGHKHDSDPNVCQWVSHAIMNPIAFIFRAWEVFGLGYESKWMSQSPTPTNLIQCDSLLARVVVCGRYSIYLSAYAYKCCCAYGNRAKRRTPI